MPSLHDLGLRSTYTYMTNNYNLRSVQQRHKTIRNINVTNYEERALETINEQFVSNNTPNNFPLGRS